MASAKAGLADPVAWTVVFAGSVTTGFFNTAWVQHPFLEAGEILNQYDVFDDAGHKSKGP